MRHKTERVRAAEGYPDHRPPRSLAKPTLHEFGPAPKHLSATGKRLWSRLAEELEASGIAGSQYRTILEGLCSAYVSAIDAEAIIRKQGPTVNLKKLDPRTGQSTIAGVRARPE